MITELEIFRMCLKTEKVCKIMDRLTKKRYKFPKERIKSYMKMFFRVWNGLTKYIKSQTNQNRLVSFSLLGSFYLYNGSDNDNEQEPS